MKINFKNLTVQVLIAIALGILVGQFFPHFGEQLKVLGDVFIKMIKMVIAPIVFFTIVIGIAGMGDMKKVGRIGGKALLYFEIVTTFALAIGVVVVTIINPGAGLDTSKIKADAAQKYVEQANATSHGFVDFLVNVVPDNAIAAMSKGEMLPVLFFSVLFGLAMAAMGERSKPVMTLFERISEVFFGIVGMIMKFSPIAAFGAMAYTIGKFGISSLFSLGQLMASVYITMILFVVFILGAIAKFYGFNIFSFLK